MKLVPLFMSAAAVGITAFTLSTQADVSQASPAPVDDPLRDIVTTALAESETGPEAVLALDNGKFISYNEVQAPIVGEEFKNYCERYPWRCNSFTQEYGMVQEAETIALMKQIHLKVNSEVVQADDEIIHGTPEYWTGVTVMDDTRPEAKAGDCEDIVITKIEEAEAAGISASSFSIVIVDPNIEGSNSLHAVLAMRTGWGDLIYDNLTDEVRYLDETGYTPIQATTFSDHSQWQGISLTEAGVSASIGDIYETYQGEEAEPVESPAIAPVFPLSRPKGL